MIMAKGCPYEAATLMLKGGTGLLYLPSDTYDRVHSDPDILSIAPIFIGIAEKKNSSIREDASSALVVLTGVEPKSITEMKPWLEFQTGEGYDGGRWFTPGSSDEVVMGYEAATYEQRKVGDSYMVSISPYGRSESVLKEFKIVGVLKRTGTQDDGTVFLPIKTAQSIFNRPDQLTILGIKLKEFSGVKLEEFESRWIKLPEVQVVSLEQVKSTLVMLIGTAQVMILAVTVIAILVAVIGVINTILMSVYERTGEIGVMKALGAFRGDVFQLIWLETLAVCVSGAIIGSAIALAGAHLTEKAIKALVDIGIQGSIVTITWPVLLAAFVGAAVVGFFAGLYPAWRAASMLPVNAIREGIG
jgi:putative ABC transport system permease protein